MTKDVWVISDTHFNHSKILEFNGYDGKPIRNFANVNEMNQCMLDNWNDTVKDGDTVIHCGDVLFGMDKVAWMEANFAKLPGKKKLALGNHDNIKHLAQFFKDVQYWYNIDNFVFTHMPLHPQTLGEKMRWDGQNVVNVHGHIHSNPCPEGPYKCVCVEQINFTPVHIEELMNA